MNKKNILMMSLLILFSTNLPIMAENIENQSTISISSHLTKQYQPDTAKIRFFVSNQGLNVKDLKDKNDATISKLTKEVKLNLTDKESIKTVDYRINNIYSYKDKARLFQKYEVQNTLEIKLKDLNKVSKIIEIITNNDVKNVENVEFYIEDTEDICNNILKEVSKNAKKRAEIVSSSLGMQLGKVKSATPYCNTSSRPFNRYVAFSQHKYSNEAVDQSYQETIQKGAIDVTSSINLIYYLK